MKTLPKPLTVGEEKEYLEHHKKGDQSVRGMLIGHNMCLAARAVKKYQGSGYDMEDPLSVGAIGLIKAVNTFNADKGSRPITYVARYAENKILMPLHANKESFKEVFLFEPMRVNKDGEIMSSVDVVEMDNRETLDTMILKQDIKELYEAFESYSTETEKTVLGMRYGLYRGKECTQHEIAGSPGTSRSYVSRIEEKTIERIRAEFSRHGG